MDSFNQSSFFDDGADAPASETQTAPHVPSDDLAETPGAGAEVTPTAADAQAAPEPVPVAELAPQTGASAPTPGDAFFSDPGQDAVDAFFGPPRLQRPRPERPALIPRWVWIAAASVVALLAVVGIAMALLASSGGIVVPKVVGVDSDTAKTRLAEQNLTITISERRFSSTPAGTVLEQTPDPGTKLKAGDAVSVIVSAGTEQFAMPSVVGDGLLLAKGLLEARGLDVAVEPQPSQLPSDTVLASNPPAGTAVQTGALVRLTVAAQGPTQQLLLPYDLTGVRVVIDPAPVNDALNDVPLDVARRLRSLIEASHGTVVATRALADTSTLEAEPARARRAAATTATVAIGLSAVSQGSAGLVVFWPSPVLAYASDSAKLASRVASDLAAEAGSVQSATSTTDTVLSAARSPWTRVQLGSFSQREDVSKFGDAAWEDSVARGLYRAIAGLYGHKSSSP